jgi:hypothetical protein
MYVLTQGHSCGGTIAASLRPRVPARLACFRPSVPHRGPSPALEPAGAGRGDVDVERDVCGTGETRCRFYGYRLLAAYQCTQDGTSLREEAELERRRGLRGQQVVRLSSRPSRQQAFEWPAPPFGPQRQHRS